MGAEVGRRVIRVQSMACRQDSELPALQHPRRCEPCCRAVAAAGAASSRAGSPCSRPEAGAPPVRRQRALNEQQRPLMWWLPGTKQARGPRSHAQKPALLSEDHPLANALSGRRTRGHC